MPRNLLRTIAFMTLITSAQAGELFTYATTIGTADMRNSSGAFLSDPGAILQQDRANFHRFGKPDEGDRTDPLFGDPNMRSKIPQLYLAGPRHPRFENWLKQGYGGIMLDVTVCGSKGKPDHIALTLVIEGGDDFIYDETHCR